MLVGLTQTSAGLCHLLMSKHTATGRAGTGTALQLPQDKKITSFQSAWLIRCHIQHQLTARRAEILEREDTCAQLRGQAAGCTHYLVTFWGSTHTSNRATYATHG